MGTGLELDVITAVVLGGTSIFGGARHDRRHACSASCLIQVLKNGLALSGVKGDGTIVVIGTVLILAILISQLPQPRRETAEDHGRPREPTRTDARNDRWEDTSMLKT